MPFKDLNNKDNSPSPLFELFSNPDYRDIFSILSKQISLKDINNVKQLNKSAYKFIEGWLDVVICEPAKLLLALSALTSKEMARFLQKFFYSGSVYFKQLEQATNLKDDPAAYICFALVSNVMKLDLLRLSKAMLWMQTQHFSPTLVESISVINDMRDAIAANDHATLKPVIDRYPLAYINFQGMNLSNMNLGQIKAPYANFQSVLLKNTNLEGAILDGAVFDNSDLSNANFKQASLQSASFKFAKMEGAHFEKANIAKSKFVLAEMSGANLNGSILEDAKLQGSNLDRATLNDANAARANFYQSDLSFANVQFGNYSRANFQNSTLIFTNFLATNMAQTNTNQAKRKFYFEFLTDNVADLLPNKKRK